MATVTKQETWKTAAALARAPGKYKHPVIEGLGMRVSPKLKAVYTFGFRDAEGALQRGKLGDVADSNGIGLSAEEAIAAFWKKWAEHKTVAPAIIVSKKDTLDLATAFLEWIEKSEKRGGFKKAQTTIDSYIECYSRYLEPTSSTWILSKTTADDWQKPLTAAKLKSISGARVAYWLLHAIYAHFMEFDTLEKNPLSKQYFRSKFSGGDSKTIRKTQIETLDLKPFLDNVFTLRNKNSMTAILVLLFTGWRLNAVMRMQWKDIDFEKGEYTVHKFAVGWKGFEGQMALNSFALEYLKLQKNRCYGEEYVFPGRHGKTKHQFEVRGSLNVVCRDLGIHVTAHDMRRTFSTIADVMLDGNLRLVGLLISHKQQNVENPHNPDTIGNPMTARYIIRNIQAERASSRLVAEAIAEIGDMLPLSDETIKKFKDRGVDLHNLTLIDIEDDDDTGTLVV